MAEETRATDGNGAIFPELDREKVIQAGRKPFTVVINAHSARAPHSLHQHFLHPSHTLGLPISGPGEVG